MFGVDHFSRVSSDSSEERDSLADEHSGLWSAKQASSELRENSLGQLKESELNEAGLVATRAPLLLPP